MSGHYCPTAGEDPPRFCPFRVRMSQTTPRAGEALASLQDIRSPASATTHEEDDDDLPGFGKPAAARWCRSNPRPPGADAVESELDRLGLHGPALVGNSPGGWVALELAQRGRAARAVVISPSGLEPPPERAVVIALNLALSPDAAVRDLHDFGYSPGFQSTLGSTVASRAAMWLGEIEVPVRVAYGTLDLMLDVFTAPRFATAIPGAELVPLPAVGHVPMLDDPELVARTILDFTADTGPPARRAATRASRPSPRSGLRRRRSAAPAPFGRTARLRGRGRDGSPRAPELPRCVTGTHRRCHHPFFAMGHAQLVRARKHTRRSQRCTVCRADRWRSIIGRMFGGGVSGQS
jgi:hypothetical protein